MDDLGNDFPEQMNLPNISVFILDQHHHAHKIIKQTIQKDLLPKTGNTIIHLDAHIDELVPKNLQILPQLESKFTEPKLFESIGTEKWLKTAVDDKYLQHVIWLKPPWAIQVQDTHLDLDNNVTLDIKTLGRSVFENIDENYNEYRSLFASYIKPGDKYILDIEYSFFSSDNPFTTDYPKAKNYYLYLNKVFELPSHENLNLAAEKRNEELINLKNIFKCLEDNKKLPSGENYPSELLDKVSKFREYLLEFYKDEKIEWDSIYNAGVVANDYQLPVHHTSEEDIKRLLECVGNMLNVLDTPPTIVTVAVMYEYDRYTPKHTCQFIGEALNEFFTQRFENVSFEYEDY